MQISLLVADDMFGQIPPLEKDLYFGEPPPDALPYTKSAARAMSQPHLGSTADLRSHCIGCRLLAAVHLVTPTCWILVGVVLLLQLGEYYIVALFMFELILCINYIFTVFETCVSVR